MIDPIDRQTAIEAMNTWDKFGCNPDGKLVPYEDCYVAYVRFDDMVHVIKTLPSVQQSIYGYDIEHLKLIAQILQKENLPPERVKEALINIEQIITIVYNELEENLKKAI